MNTRPSKLAAAILIFVSAAAYSQTGAEWLRKNKEAIDTLRKGTFTLKITDEKGRPISAEVSYELYSHEFKWGTALRLEDNADDEWYTQTARKYFNYGVPENAFKWSYMEPKQGQVQKTGLLSYIQWCNDARWGMMGNCLLWGSKNYSDFHEMPKWAKDLPPAEMYNACKTRVKRDASAYRGSVQDYVVLNEALPGHSDWLQGKVGDSINWQAFKWAREAAPGPKLWINDYNVIEGNEYPQYIELIRKLRQNGAPIDGIGVQGHFADTLDPIKMKHILDTLSILRLPLEITEFDMLAVKSVLSEEQQAAYYTLAMRTAFAHPAVEGFIFWGFWDSRHWRNAAGLFDANKAPKAAAGQVYDLIHKEWSTKGKQSVSPTHSLTLNGFFGTYKVDVKCKGITKTYYVPLTRARKGETVVISFSAGKEPVQEI
jgi:endo-1,4-beta-xylanase